MNKKEKKAVRSRAIRLYSVVRAQFNEVRFMNFTDVFNICLRSVLVHPEYTLVESIDDVHERLFGAPEWNKFEEVEFDEH